MNPIIKEHLISAAQTFVASFLTILGTSIATIDQPEWSAAFIGALLLSAVRAAVKEVFAQRFPVVAGRK